MNKSVFKHVCLSFALYLCATRATQCAEIMRTSLARVDDNNNTLVLAVTQYVCLSSFVSLSVHSPVSRYVRASVCLSLCFPVSLSVRRNLRHKVFNFCCC